MKAALFLAALLSAQAPACFAWGSRAKTAPGVSPSAAAKTADPLEPLSVSEIDAAREALKSSKLFGESASYLSISLQEPAKDETAPDRRLAFALVYDRQRRETSEAVVDVAGRRLESWRLVPGVEPGISDDELRQARELALSDPRVKQALEERGRGTWDDILVDGWAPGPFDPARSSSHRLVRADFYVPDARDRRAVDGLQALVDLTDSKVLEVADAGGSALPAAAEEAPVQPSTASAAQPFVISGHEISWRGWRLRYALTPREGLTLYRVSDGSPARRLLNRASVSETLIVYGDSRGPWAARSIFQEGERGWGERAVPLEPGVDAPRGAALLGEPRADGAGRGQRLPRAVGVFERDGGRSGNRRLRELVLESKAAAGLETYVFSWIFGEDGELDARVSVEAGASKAPFHQHFFSYRVDFDVDGSTNSVDELSASKRVPLSGPDQARRDVDHASGRRWLVTASSAPAAADGYLLIPEGNDAPLGPAGSPPRKAAPFIDHQVWITAYHPDELYAAGEYPGRRAGGVERWTRRDESIGDGDVVIWYTLGASHFSSDLEPSGRPLQAGFRLVPAQPGSPAGPKDLTVSQ